MIIFFLIYLMKFKDIEIKRFDDHFLIQRVNFDTPFDFKTKELKTSEISNPY